MRSLSRLTFLVSLGFGSLTSSALAQTAAPAPAPAPAAPAVPAPPAPASPAPVANQAKAPAAAPPPAPPPTSEPTTATPIEAGPKTLTAAALPPWLHNLSVGGGVILYLYQPTISGGKNNLDVFFANLLLDGKWGNWGLHLEPRFRDTKLRPFFDGPVWLQEAYASASFDPVTIKVGKAYKKLGLFWDNSFYGNIQVYDGLKLDPNYGVSVEGSLGQRLGAEFSAQYFVVDGRSNVSLQGRDTLSVPGARRRNAFVGRLQPFFKFDQETNGTIAVGVSAEHFTADLPTGKDGVTRFAVEAKGTYEHAGIWGEFLLQRGKHVTDFPVAGDPTATPPVAGQASGKNRYFEVGGEYTYWRLTARYNVSFAKYSDVGVSEVMHVPALGVKLHDNVSLLGEYVIWKRDSAGVKSDVDKSLNVTLSGHF